jgi:hypothetical protein
MKREAVLFLESRRRMSGFCFVLITINCETWKLYYELLSGRQYKQGQQPTVWSASITTTTTTTSFILTTTAATTAAAAAATTTVTATTATTATEWFNFLGTGSWQGSTGQSANKYRGLWQQQWQQQQ